MFWWQSFSANAAHAHRNDMALYWWQNLFIKIIGSSLSARWTLFWWQSLYKNAANALSDSMALNWWHSFFETAAGTFSASLTTFWCQGYFFFAACALKHSLAICWRQKLLCSHYLHSNASKKIPTNCRLLLSMELLKGLWGFFPLFSFCCCF